MVRSVSCRSDLHRPDQCRRSPPRLPSRRTRPLRFTLRARRPLRSGNAPVPTERNYDVVINGPGPAGLTAALYAGRALRRSAVIERGEPGGELLNTEYLDDVIGFPKILGRDLAERFANHAKQFGAEFHEFITVTRVRKVPDGSFETETDGGDLFRSPTVIVTAGGTPIKQIGRAHV